MAYELFWEERGVLWKFAGKVSSQEALKSNLDIYGDARFDSLRYEIADFSDVVDFEMNELDIKKVAFFDKAASKSNARIKVALVAPTPIAKALLEQYAVHSDPSPWEVCLFEKLDEARAWLDSVLD
jgi:hypothetical protein